MKKENRIKILIVLTIMCFFTSLTNIFAKETEKKELTINSVDKKEYIGEREESLLYKKYNQLNEKQKENVTIVPSQYSNYYKYNKSLLNTLKKKFSIFSLGAANASSYDLSNVSGKSYISATKDQGNLGICWAMAATSAIESYALKNNMGSLNFSERQLDYALSYNYGDYANPYENFYWGFHEIGEGISDLRFVEAAYFHGVSPVLESKFGDFNESVALKTLNEVFDSEQLDYDVTGTIDFPSIDYYREDEEDLLEMSESVYAHAQDIKEHIVENGAVMATFYFDGYSEINNMVFVSPLELYNMDNEETLYYFSSGHVATIIGWNDNYGDIDGDGIGDGAWLLQNSWGEDTEYFYVSYYDVSITDALVGVTELKAKTWDHIYENLKQWNHIYENLKQWDYDYEENENTIVFEKTKNPESLNQIKFYVYYLYDENEAEYSVSIDSNNDGEIEYEDTIQVHLGINTLNIEGVTLTSDTYTIFVNGSEYWEFNISTNTTDLETIKPRVEIKNTESKIINSDIFGVVYPIYSVGYESGSAVDVNVYDENGNDLEDYISINTFPIINGYSYAELIVNDTLQDVSTVELKVCVETNCQSKYLDVFEFDGEGIDSSPYKVSTPEDVFNIGWFDGSYFELQNNIDFYSSTQLEGGAYYNNGEGWIPLLYHENINLDGNGYTISNLKGYSLFSELDDVTISNIKFSKCEVKHSGIVAEMVFNGNFDNIEVDNTNTINSAHGCITGYADGNISITNTMCSANLVSQLELDENVEDDIIFGGLIGYLDITESLNLSNNYFNGNMMIEDYYDVGFSEDILDKIQYGGIAGEIYADADEDDGEYPSLTIADNYYNGTVKIQLINGDQTFSITNGFAHDGTEVTPTIISNMLEKENMPEYCDYQNTECHSGDSIDFSRSSSNIYYEKVIAAREEVNFTSNSDKRIGTSYEFDDSIGAYTITNTGEEDKSYATADVGYFTCNNTDTETCDTMYKIMEVNDTTVTLVNTYTAEIGGVKPNGQGLYYSYNDGVYYYRGGEYCSDSSYSTKTDCEDYEKTWYTIDNNIIYGGFCWQILRTTVEGNIKLIYNGVPENGKCNNTGTDTQLTSLSKYNSAYNDKIYVGYQYGTAGEEIYTNTNDSVIKSIVDSWYETNKESLKTYIYKENYINDRNEPVVDENEYPALTTYAGLVRLEGSGFAGNPIIMPLLTTSYTSDKFSLYAGLITADEAVYGGVAAGSNSYLNTGSPYWTMTPKKYAEFGIEAPQETENAAIVYSVDPESGLEKVNYVTEELGVRPVITLVEDTPYYSGSGTKNDPFIIGDLSTTMIDEFPEQLTNEESLSEASFAGFDFESDWEMTADGIILQIFKTPSTITVLPTTITNFSKLDDYNQELLISTKEGLNITSYAAEDQLYKLFTYNGNEIKKDGVIGTGSHLQIENEITSNSYTVVIVGDVSGDGYQDIGDIICIVNHILETKKIVKLPYVLAADINKDDDIDIGDIVKIVNHILSVEGSN